VLFCGWFLPGSGAHFLDATHGCGYFCSMKEKCFQIPAEEREKIMARLRECLERRTDVLFAYLHGSFVMAERFRDIDVAVFLCPPPSSPLDVELNLETELSAAVRSYPVDVRVVNSAPLSFRYHVIRDGIPIVFDDDARAEFEEVTLSRYFDFAPFRRMYLQEALGLGI
jgi:predicted nucleotidyltransferase